MLANLFRRPGVVARFQHGPLAPYLDELVTTMSRQGYARNTIQIGVRSAAHFSRWLARRGVGADRVDDGLVADYVGGLKHYRSGGREKAGQGLLHIVRVLRQHGMASTERSEASLSQIGHWLTRYDDYLRDVAGLRAGSRLNCVRFARYFMTSRFANGEVCWSAIVAEDLSTFVQHQASLRHGAGRKVPGNVLRSLVRFLVFAGELDPGLAGAIPAVRQWRNAALPRRLSASEVECVLAAVRNSDSPNATRDHAILLLLSRLGVRAHEVAGLCLDDVDWTEGRVLIRPGKTHQERVLPLSQEIGAALVDYLRHDRPHSQSRIVFLKGCPPFDPFSRAASIGEVARAAMRRADIAVHQGMGAHTFRRTVASEMVNRGATFKDVADVLGHRCLQSTGIYAKLDLDALHRVALPWAGGAS